MRAGDALRRYWLRWSRLGMAGVLLLPLAVTSVLGFIWLAERGWLLPFVLASIILFALVRLGRLVGRGRRPPAVEPTPRQIASPGIDPEWSAREIAAYESAQVLIARRLPEPVAWEELPAEALAVIETVAADLSGGRRSALDFTVPEGLLLIDRVASRYREFLRRHVPFSDQLSVRALYWLWRRQDQALVAWETGFLAYRGVRIILNPAVGLLREVERAITAGLQDRLTDRFIRDAQAILLEEAAQAAVDLYSGRLRFSDAELMQIRLGSEERDRRHLAEPDEPVRIVLVGQVSAGKSTLVNALLGRSAAETDMAPTTDRLSAHAVTIDDIPCRLVDTVGLDGSERTECQLAAEMAEADLILWVLRANRPGREPDRALRARFEAMVTDNPARRQPPVIMVASAIDTLLSGWPFPENRLPAKGQQRIGEAMAALGRDLGVDVVIPVRAEAPIWNIDTLEDSLSAALGEALMTQRNRRRLTAEKTTGSLRENLARARRGLEKGAHLVQSRLGRRSRPD